MKQIVNDDSTVSNEELLNLYRSTQNKYYLDKLYSQVSNLIYYTCQQKGKSLMQCCNLSKEEVISIANLGLAKVINDYSFSKNVKFSTALCYYICYEFRKTYKYYKRRNRELYLDGMTVNRSARHDEEYLVTYTEECQDESINIEENVVNKMELNENIIKLNRILEVFPEKKKLFLEDAYLKNKSNLEISKDVHITYSAVSRAKKNVLIDLRNAFFNPKYLETNKGAGRCYGSVSDIPENFRDYYYLLTPKEQKVLCMRFEEKRMLKEIAKELNKTEQAIGSILQVISKKLKKNSGQDKIKIKPSVLYKKLYDKYNVYILQLKEDDQLILKLKYEDSKSYKEIATKLNKTVPGISSLVRSAEKRFEKLLIKNNEEVNLKYL